MELQLIEFYINISRATNHSFNTDIIYIDMAKAFNTVCHSKLLKKMSKLDIRGNVLKWFSSYLTNRFQRTMVNDEFSDYIHASSGVPQGSVIGPLLLLIYINDLPSIFSPQLTCSLFADDAKISLSYRNTIEYTERNILQSGLNDLYDWTVKWNLQIAFEKCAFMSIGKSDISFYSLNNTLIPKYSNFRDLGIVFDDNIKFNIHINNICSKAYVISNIIVRCFTTNNSYYLVKAYSTYIRPLLDYVSSIWNPGKDFIGLNKLIEKVQHKFIKRIYFRCNIIKSTYDIRLCFLNLMNLSHRRLRADLILAFKILNNIVDIDKSSVFTTYSTSNRIPLITIRKDKCINKETINSFSNRVSTAWNALPRSVASSKSITIFITNIDTINTTLLKMMVF